MNKLRIALALQLLFFVGWGGWLLSSRNSDSPEFYLETVPVDPRDLISGTYVALTYDISRPSKGNCAFQRDFGPLFVKLADSGRTVNTESGTFPVYEAVDCAKTAPLEPGWAAATLQHAWRGNTAKYGIEKFFLNENDPRKDARSGTVVAKVKIGHGRKLVLLDLVSKQADPQKAGAPSMPYSWKGDEIAPQGDFFQFDGESSHVDVTMGAQEADLLDGRHPVSISAWVSRQAFQGDAIFIKGSDPFLCLAHFDNPSFNQLHFYFKHGSDPESIRVYADGFEKVGKWQHICITYDGSGRADGVAIYRDGEPRKVTVINDGLPGPVSTEGPLTLGAYRGPDGRLGWHFDGEMARFRLIGRKLSASEVADLAKAPPDNE